MHGLQEYDGGQSVFISDVMWQLDNATSQVNGTAMEAWSSKHPGGAFFLFCDGSVRFFLEGGNVTLLQWLAGRADGEVVLPNF